MAGSARTLRAGALHATLATLLVAGGAGAADLTSASFTSRGGHVAAGGSSALSSASFQGGASIGQPEAVGPSGALVTLAGLLPGFWPVVVGELPNLDFDGDGLQGFLDPDDDNDGLADPFETGSGVFVSATDTGTHALDPDSDDDGFGDGVEVAAGSDPNDPLSVPAAVPGLGPWPAAGLLALLVATTLRRSRAGEGA